ncbi:hypothetical protein [Actinoplanes cyaneus]|nr:hypothetical protein [Actinoplanes cyaneus]
MLLRSGATQGWGLWGDFAGPHSKPWAAKIYVRLFAERSVLHDYNQ